MARTAPPPPVLTKPRTRGRHCCSRGISTPSFGVLTRNIQTCKPLSSVGASYHHTHPSDVPVKANFSPLLLNVTRLRLKTSPQQRGNKLAQARGIQFEPITSSYSFHLSLPTPEPQLYFPTVLRPETFLPHLQRGKQQPQISFGSRFGNQFQFANLPSFPLRLIPISEPQLCSSAFRLISVKPSIFPANQTRGRHFCFLTADWPTIWRTPTVQASNMSEQVVTNPAAEITASPVPNQAGSSANLSASVATNYNYHLAHCAKYQHGRGHGPTLSGVSFDP